MPSLHSHSSTTHDKKPHHFHRPPPPTHLTPLQKHLIAASGEFVGTFLFLYFAYAANVMLATQAGERSIANGGTSDQTNIFLALVYGFSLLVNVWAFYRISGGLLNPAVTLGMVLAGTLPALRALFLFPAQLLASMVAGGLVSCMFPGNIGAANTRLGSGTSVAQGLFIEMFMTALLVFVVLMLAAEKSKDTFIAPVGIGLALFVAMMAGVNYTGGSLNPARSFGCAVAAASFPSHHWIYWLGPFLGGALAAAYFRFVKWTHYEEVNPGQDEERGEEEGRRGEV
ncbi:aquaporin-like protein [Westerdykella ornata]|uniref:Aquaporin-like protein n=1 Tax=Westerdykella ornata TaxID=318751 RepID=A0A6A6JMA2_WESOR|nr:aquaporin-like protein [Westerdykella ornata]KAF2277790.1 aquaporin-like protein [Westerdykella ornata]